MTIIAALVAELRATGLARLPVLLPRARTRIVDDHLRAAPVFYDAHVPQTARAVHRPPVSWSHPSAVASACVCADPLAALTVPYLFETALGFTDVATAYLGRDPPALPFLYSANAFWTRPADGPTRADIQEHHRDADDIAFLVMFTYLTDVIDDADGPHELVGPDGQTRCVYGPAGTVFLADTSHPHRGLRPTRAERGVHWFRWSVSERPASYGWDETSPVSALYLGDRYPREPSLRRLLSPLVTPPP